MTIAREHARIVEMACETFARQWATQLTSRLRVMASIELDKLEMVTYDEYIATLDPHTTLVLFTADETRSTALLQIPSNTTMLWLDYLLGGPGLERQENPRELTEIETALFRSLLDSSLADMRYAFSSITPMNPKIRGLQYNPQFVQAVPASEAVLVANYSLTVGDRVSAATMMFAADALLNPLKVGEGEADPSAAQREEQRVLRTVTTVHERCPRRCGGAVQLHHRAPARHYRHGCGRRHRTAACRVKAPPNCRRRPHDRSRRPW